MPGGGRRGSGALHSVRYNERSQPEVLERRSPTGIARKRETRPNNPAPRQSHACKPTHRQPHRITGTWSAGLRPASRGSAKLAPTTPPPANLTPANPRIPNRAESRRHGAPVSDRHRAGARNPPQRPRPPPISRLQTHAPPTPQNHVEHGAPVSDRHRAGARNPHQRSHPRSRGSAKPAPTTLATPISRPRTHASPTAQNHVEHGAPVSDRHRAGARNLHRQRRPPPISRPGAPVSDRHRCAKRSENRLNPNPRKARNRNAGLPPDRHRGRRPRNSRRQSPRGAAAPLTSRASVPGSGPPR